MKDQGSDSGSIKCRIAIYSHRSNKQERYRVRSHQDLTGSGSSTLITQNPFYNSTMLQTIFGFEVEFILFYKGKAWRPGGLSSGLTLIFAFRKRTEAGRGGGGGYPKLDSKHGNSPNEMTAKCWWKLLHTTFLPAPGRRGGEGRKEKGIKL